MGVPRVTPGALSRALGEAYSEGAARWYGAGRWRAGIRVPLVSPWGREVVAHVETPSPRGIVETLEAVAFSWDELASMDEDELLDTLREVGDELLSRADDLAALVAAEAGMTASEAADEVARAADLVEHAAGLGVSEKPQKGVVLAVAPFTSPLATVAASVAYALVNRMPVIVKLPMKAPLAGLALADILNEVGLGSFAAFLPAPAARAVSLVAPSEPVSAVVSYTSRYAALVLKRASSTKIALLNTMGREAAVVLDDADVDVAASWIAESLSRHSGQACGSIAWVIADKSVEGELVDALVSRLEGAEALAPMASRALIVRATRLVRDAVEKGAVVHGGEWLARLGEPVRPAVVSRTPKAAEAFYSDVRAPLVFVSRAQGPSEAGRAAAALRGIATRLNVYTDSIRKLREVDRLAGFGLTSLNRGEADPVPRDPCLAPGSMPEDPLSAWRPLPRRAAL